MNSNDDDGSNGAYHQNSLAARCTGLVLLVSVYVSGLLGCIIAGASAPDLFTSTTTSSPSGISSASGDYAFPTTGFKEAHQSIYFAMRLNIPSQLQHAMDVNNDRSFETDGHFTVTVYGSPQAKLASSTCPSGCIACPDGDEALGLICNLLSFQREGDEVISCASGEEWCAWIPLHNIDFVSFTTYYWIVDTDNSIDEYLASIDIDSEDEENWVPEFRSLFVSERYTEFEIAWFYFWTLATLLVMFVPRYGFFTETLRERVYWEKWNPQQKWVSVLLVGLFFFNNPFFAAQVFSPAKKDFFVFFAVMNGFTITAVLLFWLERLFHFGRGPDGNRRKEHVARGSQWLLGAILFITYVTNMIFIRVSRRGDPNRIHKYPSTSSIGEQTLTALCFVYCAWLLIFAGRVWLWGGMGDALRSSTRMKFFALSSTITLVILIPSIVLEHLSPRVRGGIPFSLATGACNIYVLAVALFCTPRHVEPPSIDVVDGNRATEDIHPPTSSRPGNQDFRDPSAEPSPGWWRPKGPNVEDSGVWEEVQFGAA